MPVRKILSQDILAQEHLWLTDGTAGFLSEQWHIKNNGMFAVSCIGVMTMVVLLESLRHLGRVYDAHILRQFQHRIKASSEQSSPVACESEGYSPPPLYTTIFRATPVQQLIRSLIHAVTVGLAYILMLLAMYFNGYIILCIIIGGFLGNFLCNWLMVEVLLPGSSSGIQVQGKEETAVGSK